MSRNKIDSTKTKLRQTLYFLKHNVFVSDNAIILIATGICLFLTYNSINAMSRNWSLSEQLAADQKNKQLLSIEIETMELENEYYKTEEYQELAARSLANKKLPGENLVYLPANSDYAKNKHKEVSVETTHEVSNFEKWMRFLFPQN